MSALAITAVQVLLKYGPDAYKAVVELFHSSNPTLEDFKKLEAIVFKSAQDYIDADKKSN